MPDDAVNPFDQLEDSARKGKADRPDPWKPVKDEALRGYVRELAYPWVAKADDGAGAHRYVMTIEREDGEMVNVWLSAYVLRERLLELAPAVNSAIVLVFLGKVSNKEGNREYNSYSITTTDSDYAAWAEARVRGIEKRSLRENEDDAPQSTVNSVGGQIPTEAPF